MNSRPRIIFFGTPHFVVPVLQALISSFEVVGVVTMPDSIQGRKKILTPSPVKAAALEKNIPVLQMDQLKSGDADLFIVAAFGKIISGRILNLARYGALNIHPSLLPKFRGPTPIQSAILHGGTMSGVSIIKMDTKMDHGPIVAQWEYPLSKHDTFESLHTAMFQSAADAIPKVITEYIKGDQEGIPQNERDATFCSMISKESGYFESTNPPSPEQLDRMVRGYYPWPTAWTTIRIKSGEERIMKLLPGGMVQFEGGKPMGIKDAINGYPELKQLLEQLLPREL